jgi:branched-subunit amino acid ABC-type transport system permease component
VSLFINTQNISLLFIISQLLGLFAIGLLVFFFIVQRKNFTRYKMFLATSFAFCILIPFFSKSFPISLVLLNISMIVIIVASYKNRKKSDKRTKPLLLGRLLFLIMMNVV